MKCYRCDAHPCTCRDRVTLYHGDAREVLAWLQEGRLEEPFDLVLTDPPYSSGGAMRSDRNMPTDAKYSRSEDVRAGTADATPAFLGDNRDQRSLTLWFSDWLAQCFRLTKPTGACLSFIDWRNLCCLVDAVQAGGWVYRGLVVWDKTEAARPVKGWFRSQCEYLVAASAGTIARQATDDVGKCQPGVLRHPTPRDRHHLTEKPVGLLVDLIETRRDWLTILDPFAGAGSTGLAAKALGRRAVLIEADPVFAAIAADRLRQQLLF